MVILDTVNRVIALLFFVCFLHQLIYIPVRLFKKHKAPPEAPCRRFAVLICARNEEAVIPQLIESVKAQNYPSEYVSIFVMADNCIDATADVARRAGAAVYERQNRTQVGKGYALHELLRCIGKDFGDIFDGYFVFDADNLLDSNFIAEMNRRFTNGEEEATPRQYEILTSYRNSKNFGDNWISAGYSYWFLRESAYLNVPRDDLGISCGVSGTGFLFSRRILSKMGGWPYRLLTEDTEFTADQILTGERIGCCRDAILYDEQPTRFSQSWHQRMRWVKGSLQVFARYGGRLIRGILRGSLSCYDTCVSNLPAVVLNAASLLVNLSVTCIRLAKGTSLPTALAPFAAGLLGAYVTFLAFGLLTMLTEWHRIHASAAKKILYLFTFPVFMFTYIPISVAALFMPVTWKPIKHHARPLPAVGKRTD